jgi:hypothetical protein
MYLRFVPIASATIIAGLHGDAAGIEALRAAAKGGQR